MSFRVPGESRRNGRKKGFANMVRHIGGSLFPSADHRTYVVKSGDHGAFQTRPMPEEDTHALFFAKNEEELGASEVRIASHPNGYSCDELSKRMIAGWSGGDPERALDQFDYILACGGNLLTLDYFVPAMPLRFRLIKTQSRPLQGPSAT